MAARSLLPRFRLRLLMVAVTVCAIGLAVWLNWELIPGTYYKDANGFAHGTGTETYYYDSGSVMIKEWYRAGLIYRSTWYRPDGSELVTEEYDRASGGIGYYLREDGSVRTKAWYKYSPKDNMYLGVATIDYAPDGTALEVEGQGLNGGLVGSVGDPLNESNGGEPTHSTEPAVGSAASGQRSAPAR